MGVRVIIIYWVFIKFIKALIHIYLRLIFIRDYLVFRDF